MVFVTLTTPPLPSTLLLITIFVSCGAMVVCRVLLLLPLLLTSVRGPSDGCTLNTTVVAAETTPTLAHIEYSTSIVETGKSSWMCVQTFLGVMWNLKSIACWQSCSRDKVPGSP